MFVMKLKVSRGLNTSFFGTNLFSSMSFRSRMSLTRQRSRLIWVMMILMKCMAFVVMCSFRRPWSSMSELARGVLNSCEIVI